MILLPQDYIDRIKATLSHSPILETWVILTEMTLGNRGHFRVRLTLKNGDFVEASEFFCIQATGIEQQRYRYQWMDPTKTKLRKRWDNAPHFPEIATFPHHVHVEQEDQVFPSTMLGILDLIALLEESIPHVSDEANEL